METTQILSLDRTIQGALRLSALRQTLANEERPLLIKAQDATARLECKPDIDFFMSELQSRIHQRTIGKMETLLTGILQDVMGGDEKVAISVETKRQATSLSISVTNRGKLEDAYYARGGSIALILSLGLRFISLSRARLRKFIVIDEADCWIKAPRIPAFVNVINLLAKEMGVQVIMVSHHPHTMFEQSVSSIVALTADEKTGALSVESVSGEDYHWEDDQEGVRSIHFQNFLSCADITIPLSPGVTAFIGDNDIGKSGLGLGLRSLTRGEGKDAYIRHDEKMAMVEMDLGPEGVIGWERDSKNNKGAKGAKNTRYRYFLGETAIHETDDSQVPEWMSDLGFDTSDMDIQMGNQKNPVFLLDKPGTQQAVVLSVGKEACRLMGLQELYKADIKDYTQIKKDTEKRLIKISKDLDTLAPYADIEDELKGMQALSEEIEREDVTIAEIKRLIAKMEVFEQLSKEAHLLTEIKPATYLDCSELLRCIAKMEATEGATQCQPVALLDIPLRLDTNEHTKVIEKLERLAKLAETPLIYPPIEVAYWLPTEAIIGAIERLEDVITMTPALLIKTPIAALEWLATSDITNVIARLEMSEMAATTDLINEPITLPVWQDSAAILQVLSQLERCAAPSTDTIATEPLVAPDWLDTAELLTAIAKIKARAHFDRRMIKAPLSAPPWLNVPEVMLVGRKLQATARLKGMPLLPPLSVPMAEPVADIEALIRKMIAIDAELNQLANSNRQLTASTALAKQNLDTFMANVADCPTCGNTLGASHAAH